MIDKNVKRSFDIPTQVAFYDMENEVFIAGIGYGDKIICLVCGHTIDIAEYLDAIEKTVPDIRFPIVPMTWVSLSDDCLGDAMVDSYNGEIVI
jgi:hypothetical protein